VIGEWNDGAIVVGLALRGGMWDVECGVCRVNFVGG
jgi:hypothetical protein